MPFDQKRINGPEDTVPYRLYAKLNTKTPQQVLEEALKDGLRSDHRKPNDHRKIFAKIGTVSQAKGSAYIEQGETKVMVSVFDPREIPNKTDYSLNGEIYCEFKFAPFSCHKRRLHIQDTEEKQYSVIMRQALEATVCRHEFPNFQVDVYALVLHNDGGALSAAITAAGLALAQAGVPMYDLVTSVTLGVQKGMVLVDPSSKEEELCEVAIGDVGQEPNHGIIILSYLAEVEQITQFYQTGILAVEDMKDCVEIGLKACKEVVPLVKKLLVKHVVKSLQES